MHRYKGVGVDLTRPPLEHKKQGGGKMSIGSESGAKRAPGKRATLKTISEFTGLSPSTVSLALRGGGGLRAETYQRVMAAADELGYVPDRAGVRLRTGKTNVISLVLERTDETIDFARYLIQGIGHGIQGTRYHMNVTPDFDARESVDSIRYILGNRTADGVIVTHTTARDPRVQLLLEADFPFVTHGRTEFFTPHAYHDFRAEEFVRLAVDRLIDKGCRRLLLVAAKEATFNHNNIVSAYRRATMDLPVEAELFTPVLEWRAFAAMRGIGETIFGMSPRPDGIICDSEMISILVLRGLEEADILPNRDVRLVCKQTSDLLPALYPTVDTIEEDVLTAGSELARLLIRRIDGERPETLCTLGEPRPHWRT
jgi:LacI family transcriptional regulator